MIFKVIDKRTGKEPTDRVINNIAKKGGLMTMDIDQFFIGEDGSLVLADDCGNITYCDTERFKVEPQESGAKMGSGGNRMKIVCVPYECLCELKTFMINGIKATYEDFGDKVDCDEKAAEPYGCGDMRFLKRPAQPRILDKYHITETEYESICDELEKALSFGKCGWCI